MSRQSPKDQASAKQVTHQSLGQGEAHSKIILMGEHAVVYDYPAIALPFPAANVQVEVEAQSDPCADHYLDSLYYKGKLVKAPSHLDNIKEAIHLTLKSFKLPKTSLKFSIDSSIPVGRGMGSSAAVCVALVRAICDLYRVNISPYQLRFIVNQAEVIAHEATSGLDTLMASSSNPVIYRKSKRPAPFAFKLDAYLVVADSGQVGQTKEAVGHVARLKEVRPDFVEGTMAAIGGFVEQAYEAIAQHDIHELGRLLTYNHYYLNQLEISNSVLDRIVNACWMAGALGAKLTGGGLGGCVIALAESFDSAQKIRQAMQEAGAIQTWSLHLNQ
ncbi:mevalonate kinase [Hutsoniella sourekii]|uniref:mevalonate kinase n=1 Tax=Hutsoniella sourekii TaxID=87650 RepID=UPI0004B0BD95|nr:mevalonate kinase [Hutsoniella sourekii]